MEKTNGSEEKKVTQATPSMDTTPKPATNKDTAERVEQTGNEQEIQETHHNNPNTSINKDDVSANEQNETRYNQQPGKNTDNPGEQVKN